MIRDLRNAGLDVSEGPEPNKQWSFKENEQTYGHFGLSLDGAVLKVPEAPDTWHVLECKTHNTKSFKKLQDEGVEKSKPVHAAQMQVGMHLSGMKRALYLAKNKDTDQYESERLEYDRKKAEGLVEKAAQVIREEDPPVGISRDPAFWECKFCDHYPLCFEGAPMEKNCRTCRHVAVADESRWWCNEHDRMLTLEEQKKGCDTWRSI